MLTEFRSWDFGGVQYLVDLTKQSMGFDLLASLSANVLIFAFILVLLWLWHQREPIGSHYGNKKAVMLALLALIFAIASKTLVAMFWLRDRPFVAHPELGVDVLGVDPQSFPSGHLLVAMTIVASLYMSGMRKLGAFLFLLAVLIGLGRIAIGAHYPSDVLAAMLISVGIAWAIHHQSSSIKRYLPDH